MCFKIFISPGGLVWQLPWVTVSMLMLWPQPSPGHEVTNETFSRLWSIFFLTLLWVYRLLLHTVCSGVSDGSQVQRPSAEITKEEKWTAALGPTTLQGSGCSRFCVRQLQLKLLIRKLIRFHFYYFDNWLIKSRFSSRDAEHLLVPVSICCFLLFYVIANFCLTKEDIWRHHLKPAWQLTD